VCSYELYVYKVAVNSASAGKAAVSHRGAVACEAGDTLNRDIKVYISCTVLSSWGHGCGGSYEERVPPCSSNNAWRS
jgi:hypothetical protein